MIDKVILVCTGNICRSPMAAALLKAASARHERELVVASAGTAALIGARPPPLAIELLAEEGLDIRGHRARQLTAEIAREHDLILVMELAHQRWIETQWPILRGRVHRLGRTLNIPDPFRGTREDFTETLDEIKLGMADWEQTLFE